MGYHGVENTNNEKKHGEYKYNTFPENIRQMGEPPVKNRVYIEDYVVTYMHQIYQKKQENAVVILVGKKGEKEAESASFIYGAIEIELNILEGSRNFNAETWDKIYELVYQHFQGAEILGWGCGVSMWNSQVDNAVRQIQEKYFAREGAILFLEDLNEREEKVFCWQQDKLEEQTGYVIYYEKNPQMQDYMLLGQPKESFESSYEDKVTATVRGVVHSKAGQVGSRKLAFYSAGVLIVLLGIVGTNLLIQSTRKIDSLEKTIETLSNAAINVTEEPKGTSAKATDKPKKATNQPAKAKDKKDGAANQPESTQKDIAALVSPEIFTTPQTPDQVLQAAPTAASQGGEGDEKIFHTPQKTATPKPASSSASAKSSAAPSSSAKPTNGVKRSASSYVVRYGDTLSQIVWRQYHTLSCMEMVKKANQIKDGDRIKEGQVLYLPAYPE